MSYESTYTYRYEINENFKVVKIFTSLLQALNLAPVLPLYVAISATGDVTVTSQ